MAYHNSLKRLGGRDRDRTGDPCLQSIGLDSIRSIHCCQLLTFPTNRGTYFSLEAIPNRMKTSDSYTVRTQQCLLPSGSTHLVRVEDVVLGLHGRMA